jgi:hypothetical protein
MTQWCLERSVPSGGSSEWHVHAGFAWRSSAAVTDWAQLSAQLGTTTMNSLPLNSANVRTTP